MAAVSSSTTQSAQAQQPMRELRWWTDLGKKIMRLETVDAFRSLCVPYKDERLERLLSSCIERLKQQTDEAHQHKTIVDWTNRHYALSVVVIPPLGTIDAKKSIQCLGHNSLKEYLPKLKRYSTYAKEVLKSFKKNGKLKPLPEIIFSDVGHANCSACSLAKKRAKVAQRIQEKTAELFFNYFFPDQPYEKVSCERSSGQKLSQEIKQKLSQLVCECIGQLKGKESFDEQREVLAKWAFESCRVLGFEFTEIIDRQSPEHKILKEKFSELGLYSKVAKIMNKHLKKCPRMTFLEMIFAGDMYLSCSEHPIKHPMIALATKRAKEAYEARKETQEKFWELDPESAEEEKEEAAAEEESKSRKITEGMYWRYAFPWGYTDESFVDAD